jgi:hypothetical protein
MPSISWTFAISRILLLGFPIFIILLRFLLTAEKNNFYFKYIIPGQLTFSGCPGEEDWTLERG